MGLITGKRENGERYFLFFLFLEDSPLTHSGSKLAFSSDHLTFHINLSFNKSNI